MLLVSLRLLLNNWFPAQCQFSEMCKFIFVSFITITNYYYFVFVNSVSMFLTLFRFYNQMIFNHTVYRTFITFDPHLSSCVSFEEPNHTKSRILTSINVPVKQGARCTVVYFSGTQSNRRTLGVVWHDLSRKTAPLHSKTPGRNTNLRQQLLYIWQHVASTCLLVVTLF